MQTANNRLSELRKSKGLTQNKIAEMLGVKNSAVSKWECGRTLPDANALLFLADLYDVSLDYLLGRTDDSRLFDDARVPHAELLFLYNQLNETEKARTLAYMQSISDGHRTDAPSSPTKSAD